MSAEADKWDRSTAQVDSPLALAPDQIHLWLALYDEIADATLLAAFRELLSAAEREQEPRFYFADDRRRYLVTRALVRTVLSRYLPVSPRKWVFATNAYGRPEIANAVADRAQLSFNISHTRSLIVLGVTSRGALGVDVENFAARKVSLEIADRFFSPQEVAALARVPQQRQQYRFFEYWTFKEAYIKARGMGLSLPLDKFGFRFPTHTAVNIEIHPQLQDDPARWRFWQFQLRSQYLVAVCAERVCEQLPSVTIRQIVPLVAERPLAAQFLRASQ
jgi:4'-phosphopantetheinyl transferase